MTLQVRVPAGWAGERRYAWSVLLGEMLGIDHVVVDGDGDATVLAMPGSDAAVVVPEGFFAMQPDAWLTPASMPARPVPRLRVPAIGGAPEGVPAGLPAIYGAAPGITDACWFAPGRATLAFDIAGSAFFQLTRYEERVTPDRDAHDRFPARAALAVQEGFLERPVVDEYADLLFACLRHCWPAIARKASTFRVVVSHDIDSALFHLASTPSRLARAFAGDLVQRRDPALAWRRLRTAFAARRGHHDGDPHDTFDYLMDVSERNGLRSAFYFITGGDAQRDANYTMDMPWIGATVGRIGARGHEVGLHPSYRTYLDADRIAAELATLKACAERHGVRQDAWGGRQHYLRWQAGTTWSNWEKAGLAYDSSVGFAEQAGFRAGTCREYPVFDVGTRSALALRERPLVIMETTLIAKDYMHLPPPARLVEARKLAAACRRHGGDLTLLWHNSKVISKAERAEYEAILDIALHGA